MYRQLFSLIVLFFLASNCFAQLSDIQNEVRKRIENSSDIALSAQGERIQCQHLLPQFYASNLYPVIWTSGRLNQLIKELEKSKEEGLTPSDYHFGRLQNLASNTTLNNFQKADIELLASDAFLLYSSHLLSGKTNPQTTQAEWYVKRNEGDPLTSLQKVINNGDVVTIINELKPKHKVYQSLKNALRRYKTIQRNGNWESISDEGQTLKIDMEDDRVIAIRKRLMASEDLAKNTPITKTFDEQLKEAVIAYQKRNGLDSDGEVGKKSIASMNVSVAKRIEQIKVNLERWRWLPREFGAYYIKVNIANFNVEVIRHQKVERIHKAIVGKNYRKTPVFSSKMSYLVFNPTWTVPPGIIKGDVIPAAKKNVEYFKAKKLTVYNSSGAVVDPTTVDWNSPSARAYTFVQPPGADNALGAVKFMFPNTYSIYIHDTPAKELFEKTERNFSSGCIRIQQPLEFAEYLLNDSQKWSKTQIEAIVKTQKTQTITLNEQPEVYILYWTAWSEGGIVQFRNDIYERDSAVEKALLSKPPTL